MLFQRFLSIYVHSPRGFRKIIHGSLAALEKPLNIAAQKGLGNSRKIRNLVARSIINIYNLV
jgi:hypothetical protein